MLLLLASAGTVVGHAPAFAPGGPPREVSPGSTGPAAAAAAPSECRDAGETSSVGCAPLAPSALPGWEDGPLAPPTGAPVHLAFDAAADVTLAVVPAPGTTVGNATALLPAAYYEFNGSSWSALPLNNGPPYSAGASIAYDSTRDAAIYVVDASSANASAGLLTWAFAGGIWSNLTNGTDPGARLFAGLSDDPGAGGLLLFGGWSPATGADLADTWLLGPTGWSAVDTGTSPPARSDAAVAWSGNLSEVVLLGGCTDPWSAPATGCTNDTWTLSDGNWTARNVTGPTLASVGGERLQALATPADGAVTAIPSWAGTPPGSGAGWWTFGGGSWSYLTGTNGAPFLTASGGAVALAPSGDFLEFPAERSGDDAANATTFVGRLASWTSLQPVAPSPRTGASLTFDAADGYALLFGGSTGGSTPTWLSDTWKYAGGRWTLLHPNATPPARVDAGLVYDARDGYVLLFGGDHGNDTWEFTDGGWSRITPPRSPPVESIASMVYDVADGVVLWVGGFPTAYTWTYSGGNWTNRSSEGGPPGPPANPLVYDASDGYVLETDWLTGRPGASLPVPVAGTYGFLDGVWTNRTEGVQPAARLAAAVAADPTTGSVVLFGGSASAASPSDNDTWTYAGGNWSKVPMPWGPAGAVGMAAALDPSADRTLFFGGSWTGNSTGSLGPSYDGACPIGAPVCNDTWLWGPGALARPYVAGFTAAPSPLDRGYLENITTTVIGGTGPVTYVYQDLPDSCVPTNRSQLLCEPSLDGTYELSVTVLDSDGHAAGAATRLVVVSPLEIVDANATPQNLTVGARTLLSVATAYGTSTVAYQYLGLPPGCTSESVPTLPCTPTEAGPYHVDVVATDSGDGIVWDAFEMNVTAAGPSGGPSIDGFDLSPDALVLGNSTQIQVNASGGSGALSYRYDGLPAGCVSANASVLDCQPTAAGTFLLTLSVSDGTGSTASVETNLTVYPVGGGGGTWITAFGSAAPAVTLGTTTTLYVNTSSGSTALSYTYPILPPGCASANTTRLACTPNATGTFRLFVVVRTPGGSRDGAFATLDVVPGLSIGPSIAVFSAAPSSIRLGGTVELYVSASGGSPPLSYAYADLPRGCASDDTPTLRCTPTAPGSFNVTVTVTDAVGRSASAALRLTVLHAALPSGASGGFGTLDLSDLDSPAGAAAAAFVVVAALLCLVTESWIRRARLRRDGRVLVDALRRVPPEGEEPHR